MNHHFIKCCKLFLQDLCLVVFFLPADVLNGFINSGRAHRPGLISIVPFEGIRKKIVIVQPVF